MQLPLFEQHYFLPALGWAVINSVWQVGCLWVIYQLVIITDKKLPALVKYHLGLLFLFASFSWFLATLLQNYRLLIATPSNNSILLNDYISSKLLLLNKMLPLLGSVYLLLLSYHLLRFVKAFINSIYLERNGLSKAPLDIRLFVNKTALHVGITKKINIWLSAAIDVPCVTGIIKPLILLPLAIVNQLTPTQIEAIVLHEIAHIRRNDLLVNLLETVVMMVLFFNPFALLLHQSIKRERENCCDDWVLNFKFDQHDYARALIILEEQRQLRQPALTLTATNGKKLLLHRIKRLFNANSSVELHGLHKMKIAVLFCLVVASITCFLPTFLQFGSLGVSEATVIKYPDTPGATAYPVVSNHNDIKKLIITTPVAVNPLSTVAENKLPRRKRKPARVKHQEIINTYINEDLLRPARVHEPSIIAAAEKEIESLTYFIKVEEEQSGEKQQNTYLLELSNKDGYPEVKPLIIVNKIKGTTSRPLQGDSTRPAKKKIVTRRITS